METSNTDKEAIANGGTIGHRVLFALRHVPQSGAVVLDYGCGPGFHCRHWQRSGNRVIGVDSCEPAISRARRDNPGIEFVYSEGKLPMADGSVDMVIMLDVIEHVEDERSCLTDVLRVLKPGGALVLTTPFRNVLGDWMDQDNLVFNPLINLINLARGKKEWMRRHRHYREEELLDFCANGFEVMESELTGGPSTVLLAFISKLFSIVNVKAGKALIPPRMVRAVSDMQAKTHKRHSRLLASKINLALRKRRGRRLEPDKDSSENAGKGALST